MPTGPPRSTSTSPPVDHVSAYALIVEEGTRLARRVARGELRTDDDVLADRYEMAEHAARGRVSSGTRSRTGRPARPRAAAQRAVLGDADWWGVGPGAHSHVGGLRWWNVSTRPRYAVRLAAGECPAAGRELLDDDDRARSGVARSSAARRAGAGRCRRPAGGGPRTPSSAVCSSPTAHATGRAVLTTAAACSPTHSSATHRLNARFWTEVPLDVVRCVTGRERRPGGASAPARVHQERTPTWQDGSRARSPSSRERRTARGESRDPARAGGRGHHRRRPVPGLRHGRIPDGHEEELDQTIKSVEALDRRAVKVVADVRDPEAMKAAFETGIAELGTSTSSVPTRASPSLRAAEQTRQHYIDVLNVNLVGVINTVLAGLPHLPPGGSVIVTGSLAALLKGGIGESGSAYTLASGRSSRSCRPGRRVAEEFIRVNGVHPTNCNTNLLQNDGLYRALPAGPGEPHQGGRHPGDGDAAVDAGAVGRARGHQRVVLFLASDASKYVTGQFINVDAGGHLKTLD